MADIVLKVNGVSQTVDAAPETQLLYVLRNQLQMNGPKFGCGLTQCGACTVLIDGEPVRSCLAPVSIVGEKEVVTLDGLSVDGKPGPVQQAFIDEQAAQCGYCINGMVMMATSLLAKNPAPTDDDIRTHLAANLCRCGTHTRIIKAIMRAAAEGAGQ
jgi:aerobic-type carbon monoxide dehydrogenase small subunit (CoxS/CutS family)